MVPGRFEIPWTVGQNADLARGVYHLVLRVDGRRSTGRKVVLVE